MLIKSFIDRLTTRLVCHTARRKAIAELSSLDDRTLYDIGLFRGAIGAEVDGSLAARGCSGQSA